MQATEGIILKTYPFQERSHIVHVLSKKFGRIAFVHKTWDKKKGCGFSSLLKVDAEVLPSTNELWKCRNLQILTSFPRLRTSLAHITHAACLLECIHDAFGLHQPTPELYTLLEYLLLTLQEFCDPQVATCRFLLCCLISEGLCNFEQGRFLCPKEAFFSEKEREIVYRIFFEEMSELKKGSIPKQVFEKILRLYKSSFR